MNFKLPICFLPMSVAPKDRWIALKCDSGYMGYPYVIHVVKWCDDYKAWLTVSHDRVTDYIGDDESDILGWADAEDILGKVNE